MPDKERLGFAGLTANAFVDSKLTPLILIASILLGLFAVYQLPREEEPQIRVPFFDIFVPMPGSSAEEVEKRIADLGERKLWEIPGVEYVYSTSAPNLGMIIVRFKVGSDPAESLAKLFAKVQSNADFVPPGAAMPLIKPRSIDDVPILALTFWTARDDLDDVALRRIAAEVRREINTLENISETLLIGGHRRTFKIFFDPDRLAEAHITPLDVAARISAFNTRLPAGHLSGDRRFLEIETESFIRTLADLESIVVGVSGGRAVQLKDVARLEDGADESEQSVSIRPKAAGGAEYPAVTLSISKRPGSNAVWIVRDVMKKVDALKRRLIPDGVNVTVTRDYGRTASEKSNELLYHMMIATVSVILLIWLAMGWRGATVVGLAVPATLALTLLFFYLYGFTLNRITLFALIFSIGILVDDAIVVVENIERHAHLKSNTGRPLREVAVEAVAEVGNPTVLATWTVIAAILPMAFVTGLMGEYMRAIPIGSSAAMIFSLLVAFIATPWAARIFLRPPRAEHDPSVEPEGWLTRLYRRWMTPLLSRGRAHAVFFGVVVVLFSAAVALVPLKQVVVKMLPFDNKSEFQVVINMPEGTALSETRRAADESARYIESVVPEVRDIEIYAGTSAPYNFNGLVRHYFLRQSPHQADLQVNLVGKHGRKRSSHQIAVSIRDEIHRIIGRYGGRVQVAEVPPGPPVLSTLVLEVYGPDHAGQIELARQLRGVLLKSPMVTDVDYYYSDTQPLERLTVDRVKSSLNGIPADAVAQTLRVALNGTSLGLAHLPAEPEPVDVWMRLPDALRAKLDSAESIRFLSPNGNLIPVSYLTRREKTLADQPIYHKNMKRVVYVVADVQGRLESPVYPMLALRDEIDSLKAPDGTSVRQFVAGAADVPDRYAVNWDGEIDVTADVFRDLGIAFAAVLVLIYILIVAWFQSFAVPLVIMAPIPLALIGILPAHALLGAKFSAPSMIGFIAGAGIVVRNSIILVDFIELRLRQGMSLSDAVVDAGAVRFRPMLLTAAAVIVGTSVILFDPIFQGLAVSLMAGEIASTLISRIAVPVLYFMLKRNESGGK
ncbi:MAG: multidrug transporter AcrB [Candidatus Lindowbacteria bacterium RIFCSPLOWO2_12_FULL_62_27]|nr:MAG: multidrug transporter AcrB [Candidatus Lindowbacteria bacterium RIFCSPLOWO2_02_FULL_62_12]OGH62882.1 MAG: multidrug transporter AcrB [Candidatus Lindowbacteria bacterium RIFCSPLOWO2_12_FULL_62_27]